MGDERVCEMSDRDLSERLVGLLRRQRALYGRLGALADEQHRLIAGDDPQGLLRLLGERQALVEGLSALNEQLGPFRREWEAVYPRLGGPRREEVRRLLAEVDGLLGVIVQADERDTRLLSEKKADVGRSLAAVGAGRQAHAAYAGVGAGASRFVDQTDEAS